MATTSPPRLEFLDIILKNKTVIVPILVIGVVATIVLPMPVFIIDILISINLSLTVMMLLITMYIDSPADFNIFPSMILVMTLYRLALNIASTRLILSNAGDMGTNAAGTIIGSFGSIVIAGNYVIGAVIFLLIVIVQFLVIAKGSVRIGEVAARFTLDALPGKQMAIDADLNAGFIDEKEARERREKISKEAAFFGAMDGSVRFTSKDAVASMLITIINIVGGLIIGTTAYGMEIDEAAAIFTTLTIGDGLVSALPSLIIAVSAGMMVTRSGAKENLGEEVSKQLFVDYRPLGIATLMMLLFAVFLEPARLIFLALTALLGFIAFKRYTDEQKAALAVIEEEEEKAKEPPAPERVESLLPLDPLGLEVGYNLIPLVDVGQGGNILERIKGIRRQLALEMGIIIPPIRIRDNLQLEPNEYSILLRGIELTKGSLMMNHLLAMSPGEVDSEIEGLVTRDPAFGLPAIWISEEDKERAQISGYTVVDTATVISTHLTESLKANAYKLLGRQETQALVDLASETSPKLVEDLIPAIIHLGGVQKVLQNLLKERISIRDMNSILETLSDYAHLVKDYNQLTEYVRMSLGRAIVQPYLSKTKELSVLTLNPQLEAEIANSVQQSEAGSFLAMEPHAIQNLLEKLKTAIESAVFPVQPILLTSSETRMHIAQLTEKFLAGLVVISHAEIPATVSVINLGVVG